MCGIVGIISTTTKEVGLYIYDALTIIQHRGQDAAGIVTSDKKRFFMRKSNGLVRNVFRTRHMTALKGNMGIGHVRYPTAGSSSEAEAQPFYVNFPYGIALAHNGNITNTKKLIKELSKKDKRHINTNSDSEILLNILASEIAKQDSKKIDIKNIFKAVKNLHTRVNGAYAVIGTIVDYGIFGFRDPKGIRPLILGEKESSNGTQYMLASESVALTALGYKITRDVMPGEVVIIKKNGELHSQKCFKEATLSPCIFEFVYFARPDSIIDKISVYKSRLRMGDKLAEKIKKIKIDKKIDVVIPIPETSRIIALQLAYRINIKYREGFIKNRYIARTFIMPGQKERKKSVKQKLSAINLEFKDKNVLLIDDSIVRGTTSKEIVQMARNAGAKKVFFASAAPPVIFPNVYGIDMPSKNEFIAHNKNLQEICDAIGADQLIYQELKDLIWSVKQGNKTIKEFDCSCFNGHYITSDIDKQYLKNIEKLRCDNSKQKAKKNKGCEMIYNDIE